ncbi:MAG: hypothetical protein IKV55_05595, partial [Oscillospiraceae bacterium]|nr:hypothetical protein [Oscillospiraceae bacterium]
VQALVDKAKLCYANLHLQDAPGQVRMQACGVITFLADAVMLYHGTYFKRGTKRMLSELAALPLDSVFTDIIAAIAASGDVSEIRALAKRLIQYTEAYTRQEQQKKQPSAALAGTYEEMHSNWRNKVEEAAANGNVTASFMNLCSLQYMLADIAADTEIGTYDIMAAYNPNCLAENTRLFDACLQKYEGAYKAAGIAVKRYADIDAFTADYLQKQAKEEL